ncbi:amidohydrolase family protein [Phaeobacter gallaeciensis]|uniref:Metal-dependent hydrolase of the TIM-barrel fold protein n=1 Tax=Phaeobacter gallaeciensis TaxID=60890 RepID=A0AAC9Z6M5_9RHOB|nr:amidohydrolase family protein [Phaeobacter gallaeciensis]AHD08481.1 putative metal-dependent hydrolase of the TIM-barrel fold protein [Phaeobacter gallaeciensis DSM 26640]ATE91747.1 putative metal-dependent hydrolase of the TIM-barrel fold protein [Phaeobacter gallaeciensis]ATE98429.1 putative metal-dependent hydrolase of the TIM-barrel fold protein [Phaeobacter gallaeciensis]ATF00363.1 putative metal-dependent hydrolase of the TIM-barrel fold protein [Phaeobacter gallaeciensis]ATF04795.1 p
MIDAHHHLWDLAAVHYPWLSAKGVSRFFGDPSPIQRNYLLPEFRAEAAALGITGSVHIQVGAEDPLAEAKWVQSVAEANPGWPLVQVVHCDLTAPDLAQQLDVMAALPTVRGVRQIVGRAPGEDAQTGTNALLDDPRFLEGLLQLSERGLSFDLQLIPELMEKTARVLAQAPRTNVALCHAGSPHDRSPEGLGEWRQRLRWLSDLPHVWCKLSGLGMFQHRWTVEDFRPIIETCLDQFGADRCMFGSNFPVDSLYSDYETLLRAHEKLVPDSQRSQVFAETAAGFYKF